MEKLFAMGVHADAVPDWLLSSWVRSCLAAGATASPDVIRAAGQGLLDRWDAPDRKYHNITHLIDVLSRVDELSEETHEPDLVRLAAWYHGAKFSASEAAAYASRGGEDEEESAELALSELAELGVPERERSRVAELVRALLRHTAAPHDFDCAVLCDADLSMLAAEPQRYSTYLAELREEYAHIPVRDYVTSRIAILTRLRQREHLFASGTGAAWEESARQNLDAELARLTKELAALDQAADD